MSLNIKIPMFTPLPEKSTLPFFIFFCLLFFCVLYWRYYNPVLGTDDANISFVYMRNLAEGNGFIFNTGGEKVEGFTSLSWVLLGSGILFIKPSIFKLLLLILSFALTFITIYKTLLFSRNLRNKKNTALSDSDILIVFSLLLPLGFIEWGVLSLMETSLWIFLIVTTTLELSSYYLKGGINTIRFTLLIVAMIFTRPESIVLSAFFILLLFMIQRGDIGLARTVRIIMLPLLVYIGCIVSLTFWRIYYFGYPLPNTYYAKVSANFYDNFHQGCRYLAAFFYNYPHLIPVALIIFLYTFLCARDKIILKINFSTNVKIHLLILSVFCTLMAIPVFTGGDHFKFSRFYQPAVPIFFLASIVPFFSNKYFQPIKPQKKIRNVALAVAYFIMVLFFSRASVINFFSQKHGPIFIEFAVANNVTETARCLNESFSCCAGYPSIGVYAAGGTGFTYKGKTIDLLGLNNTIMAHASSIKTGVRDHASFDKTGFWLLNPDIMGEAGGGKIISDPAAFISANNFSYKNDFVYTIYKGIFDDITFEKIYTPALVKNKKFSYSIFSYYSKSFLKTLDPDQFIVTIL